MTSLPRFERNLPGILEDLYLGPSPDYRDEILATARHTRQRPAWSFPERWIPVDITNRLALAPRLPIRALAVALLVLALIVAGLIAYIGSHPTRLPAPFGPARNGVVLYAVDGHIYSVDPATGSPVAVTSGSGVDRKPTVSPDGTRIVFLRGKGTTGDAFDLVVANLNGSDARTISTATISDGDPFAWSPDSTFILLNNVDGDLVRYNANGHAPVVVLRQTYMHGFQPPTGQKVLYETLTGGRTLGLMNPDGTGATPIYTIPPAETKDGCDYGTVAWSPDGARIAFNRQPTGQDGCRVFVMNADGTGAHQLSTDTHQLTETDFRWSPDGTMIAFDRWDNTVGPWQIQPIGVVQSSGGATRSLGPTPVGDGAAFEWSPDGRSIIAAPATVIQWPPSSAMPSAHPIIIDVATGTSREVSWTVSSWPSWQRLAP
jgi:Tol biopolymer transport system component